MGDCAARAVETVDFMTARFAHLPYDLVDKISTRIMNEIKDVCHAWYMTCRLSRQQQLNGSKTGIS